MIPVYAASLQWGAHLKGVKSFRISATDFPAGQQELFTQRRGMMAYFSVLLRASV